MDSPGGDQGGQSEEAGQQSHGKVGLIALHHETYGRRETGWEHEREERLRPRRQDRSCAKHHSAQNEDEKDLIHEMGFRVQQNTCGAPTCSGQARANGECRHATCSVSRLDGALRQ